MTNFYVYFLLGFAPQSTLYMLYVNIALTIAVNVFTCKRSFSAMDPI